MHEQNPALLRKIEKLKQVALARTQLSKLARYIGCLALEVHYLKKRYFFCNFDGKFDKKKYQTFAFLNSS